MKWSNKIQGMLGLGLLASLQVAAEPPTQDFLNADINVVSSYDIETDKLIMMELDTGEMLLATGDGKFLIKGGSLFSTVHTKFVNSPQELYAASHVDLKKMKINPEEDFAGFNLNPLAKVFGGTLFIAPTGCKHCGDFVEILEKQHPDKRFRIAIVPVFDDKEYENTLLAQCSDDPDKALHALYEGTWSEAKYPRPPNSQCKEAITKVNSTYASLQIMSPGRVGLPAFFNNKTSSIIGLPTSKAQLTSIIVEGIDL
ncbi:hypothetical protein AB6E39_15675 [Vibrio splendidus]|uniref:hypothetical protein n=1 Tax=Vibrio splendidus TaxID=29497 RepID=UPI001E2908B4|nr:hypothetical protein [Vibrio splendidus]MCC4789361.1 hypothetical protein [Vibrio splendidus]